MHLTLIADTDVGIRKAQNEDSLMIKHAMTDQGEIALAVICDGMGGLAKGELASATVIREFAEWFDRRAVNRIFQGGLQAAQDDWDIMLRQLNVRIMDYGREHDYISGTTFSGILMFGNHYLTGQVGDSRIYRFQTGLEQLTKDQTVVQREVDEGKLTPGAALKDKRRSILLQCVGASRTVVPVFQYGTVGAATYLLCSDGFHHELTEREMCTAFLPETLTTEDVMQRNVRNMIEVVKSRGERDNISVVLIKAE